MTAQDFNRTLLVVGYGSLLSGYGLLAERRGGRSRLVARDVEPVSIRNARRGLAKPSSHGSYLAMDIEPVDRATALTATAARNGDGIGGLLLTFDRADAAKIAQREEYDPAAFERLIALADRSRAPLGRYLLEIARETNFSLLDYRRALRALLGYTSAGYIFHPIEIDDGRVAIIAIGSGYEGSGDPDVVSWRFKFGMDRLLTLGQALERGMPGFDRGGQIGYFAECILGGLHGLAVGDLADGVHEHYSAGELARRFRHGARGERSRFMLATSLDPARYAARFAAAHHASLDPLLKLDALG